MLYIEASCVEMGHDVTSYQVTLDVLVLVETRAYVEDSDSSSPKRRN